MVQGNSLNIKQISLKADEILTKLSLIEKHLGYSTMCFYIPTYNRYGGSDGLINAQKEATQMMKHVGLSDYMPVITFTDTKLGVGGNVELDNSEFVFIEIDQSFCNNPEKVLAVMAHEICHKVLFTHGLYYRDKQMSMENEILTDLTTVYVGFGKLSLNGCYKESQTKTISGDTTIKRTETIGYITLNSFATAYTIVCSRFNIPRKDKIEGLGYYATQELCSTNPFSYNITVKDLKETIKTAQDTDSEMLKYIIVIESMLSQIKNDIKERFQIIHEDLVSPFNYDDEALSQQQFLAIKAVNQYRKTGKEFEHLNSLIKEFEINISHENTISINHDEISTVLKDLVCPICGYKKPKALKENRKALFKCNKCNHYFLWDGELVKEDNNQLNQDPKQVTKRKEWGFFSRLFNRKHTHETK